VTSARTKTRARPAVRPLDVIMVRELAPHETEYRGIVRSPADFRQKDLHTVVLSTDGTIPSDSSGILAPVFGSSPAAPGASLGACAGWSSLASTFDEFRTLAFEVEFLSVYDQLISGASQILAAVIDYDANTALSSYGVSDNYSSQRMFSVQEYDGKVKRVVARMTGIENAGFQNTASPAALYWIKFFASNLAISSQVIHVFVRYRVQFRGRGI